MGKTIMTAGIIVFAVNSIGYIVLEIWLYYYRKKLKDEMRRENNKWK